MEVPHHHSPTHIHLQQFDKHLQQESEKNVIYFLSETFEADEGDNAFEPLAVDCEDDFNLSTNDDASFHHHADHTGVLPASDSELEHSTEVSTPPVGTEAASHHHKENDAPQESSSEVEKRTKDEALASTKHSSSRGSDTINSRSRRIFLGNLVYGTTLGDVKKVFSEFGEILEINLKGTYAFIMFDSAAAVKAAFAKNDIGIVLRGKRVDLQPFRQAPMPRRTSIRRNVDADGGGDGGGVNGASENKVRSSSRDERTPFKSSRHGRSPSLDGHSVSRLENVGDDHVNETLVEHHGRSLHKRSSSVKSSTMQEADSSPVRSLNLDDEKEAKRRKHEPNVAVKAGVGSRPASTTSNASSHATKIVRDRSHGAVEEKEIGDHLSSTIFTAPFDQLSGSEVDVVCVAVDDVHRSWVKRFEDELKGSNLRYGIAFLSTRKNSVVDFVRKFSGDGVKVFLVVRRNPICEHVFELVFGQIRGADGNLKVVRNFPVSELVMEIEGGLLHGNCKPKFSAKKHARNNKNKNSPKQSETPVVAEKYAAAPAAQSTVEHSKVKQEAMVTMDVPVALAALIPRMDSAFIAGLLAFQAATVSSRSSQPNQLFAGGERRDVVGGGVNMAMGAPAAFMPTHSQPLFIHPQMQTMMAMNGAQFDASTVQPQSQQPLLPPNAVYPQNFYANGGYPAYPMSMHPQFYGMMQQHPQQQHPQQHTQQQLPSSPSVSTSQNPPVMQQASNVTGTSSKQLQDAFMYPTLASGSIHGFAP